MTAWFRWIALAGLLAIAWPGFGAIGGVASEPATTSAHAPTSAAVASGQVDRGRYLAHLGDCEGCHTADSGKPYAGGLPIDTGFGAIYTPNITPDPATGIGSWSKDDFYRALHTGRDDEGTHLYPALPYPWFTKVTHKDADALKDYFDSVAPVRQADKPPKLAWWMRWRASLAGWNLLYFHEGTFQPHPHRSAAWNRGAYIVQGLGHCGDCHTPKGYLGGADRDEALAGGNTEGGSGNGWFAPSLRGDPRAGLGHWSEADIAHYLKTGANAHTAAAGPMADAVTKSTRYYTDDDLAAVAVYLKSLAPLHGETPVQPIDPAALARGEGLFVDDCSACHMNDGGGIAHVFPALMGSSAIQARNAASVVRVILEGAAIPAAPGQRPYLAMPAFGRKLDDQEVADVATYVRNAWGNRASIVEAGFVAKSRQALATAATATAKE